MNRGLKPLHDLAETKTLQFNIPPYLYFGDEGATKIFYNTNRRPDGQVIREVRAHIKKLQSSANEGAKP